MKTIYLKDNLPSLNEYINAERRNRFLGAKMKKDAQEVVLWQLSGLESFYGPHFYHFHWLLPNKRKDPDNISSFVHKIIFDALQVAGIIENDNLKNVVGIADTFEIGEPGIVITAIPLTQISDSVIIPIMKENKDAKQTLTPRISKQSS